MTEAEKIQGLIEEWKAAERRVVEIKLELARLLSVEKTGVSDLKSLDRTQAGVEPPGVRSSAVARGTKGRAVLECLANGYGVHLSLIAESVYGGKEAAQLKLVRSALSHLRRLGFIAGSGGNRSGQWKITDLGLEALNGH